MTSIPEEEQSLNTESSLDLQTNPESLQLQTNTESLNLKQNTQSSIDQLRMRQLESLFDDDSDSGPTQKNKQPTDNDSSSSNSDNEIDNQNDNVIVNESQTIPKITQQPSIHDDRHTIPETEVVAEEDEDDDPESSNAKLEKTKVKAQRRLTKRDIEDLHKTSEKLIRDDKVQVNIRESKYTLADYFSKHNITQSSTIPTQNSIDTQALKTNLMAIKVNQDKEKAIYNIMNGIQEKAPQPQSTKDADKKYPVDIHVSAFEARRLLAHKPSKRNQKEYDLKIIDIDHHDAPKEKEKMTSVQRNKELLNLVSAQEKIRRKNEEEKSMLMSEERRLEREKRRLEKETRALLKIDIDADVNPSQKVKSSKRIVDSGDEEVLGEDISMIPSSIMVEIDDVINPSISIPETQLVESEEILIGNECPLSQDPEFSTQTPFRNLMHEDGLALDLQSQSNFFTDTHQAVSKQPSKLMEVVDVEDKVIPVELTSDSEPDEMDQVEKTAFFTEAPALKSKFVASEASESEDEFHAGEDEKVLQGMEGDGDIICADKDATVAQLEAVYTLHREFMEEKDRNEVDALLNEVTSGALRKRGFGVAKRAMRDGRGGEFDESDEDDEAILARIKLRLKRYGRKAEDDDEVTGIEKYAANPETNAFSKCFAIDNNGEGFLSENEFEGNIRSLFEGVTDYRPKIISAMHSDVEEHNIAKSTSISTKRANEPDEGLEGNTIKKIKNKYRIVQMSDDEEAEENVNPAETAKLSKKDDSLKRMLEPHLQSISIKDKLKTMGGQTQLKNNKKGLNWRSGDTDMNKNMGKGTIGFGSSVKQPIPIVQKSGKRK